MIYLGCKHAGVNSCAVPIGPGHALHAVLEAEFASGAKALKVYTDGKYYGTFENTDRFRLSVGKKRHVILKAVD